MTQQICPQCRQTNELSDEFCRRCGRALALQPVPYRHRSAMTVGGGSLLPAPTMKQVAQAVTVSLVALAAEVGIVLLRRRIARMSVTDGRSVIIPKDNRQVTPSGNAIVSRRVVQFWRKGRMTGQVVEQSIYQEFD